MPKLPTKPKPRAIAASRPPKGGLAQAIDDADQFRPAHVPPEATVLVSWVKLPGDNAQRGHWAKRKAWQDALKDDFGACLNLQGHPGLYANPAVHIAMHVARKGDDNNMLARAKYAIDLLQVQKLRADGRRTQGLLDLIADDRLLGSHNRTVEERAVSGRDTGRKDRYGRAIKEAPYKVMIWVWDAGH